MIDIDSLSGPELVGLFNEITGESVKRFSSRAAGIRRVKAAMAENLAGASEEISKEISTASSSVHKPAPIAGQARRKRIEFPARPAGEIKDHRSGTKRATVIGLLRQGATMQQLMSATGWDYKTAYDGVKLVHSYLGYGLREDESGVVTLIDPRA